MEIGEDWGKRKRVEGEGAGGDEVGEDEPRRGVTGGDDGHWSRKRVSKVYRGNWKE